MPTGPPETAAFRADAQAQLAEWREPRAAGAAADVEALRRAYLDLLKLCLCDLAGTSTISVGAMPDGTVMSRELRGDGLRMRAAGMDWPLQGLTMVGLGRLDDLQACVESVVADGVEGDLIEAGAWRGGASILMRATLDALGDDAHGLGGRLVRGLPRGRARRGDELAHRVRLPRRAARRRARELRAPRLRRRRALRAGLLRADAAPAGRRGAGRIVRLDADTYEPTRLALRCLYPGLAPGGHLILDDYGSFAGCRRAVDEFRAEHGIAEPIEKVDPTCVALAARERHGDRDRPPDPAPAAGAAARRRASLTPHVRSRARRSTLERRLAAAEAAIGLRPWLRRRLSGGPA